MIGGDYSDPAIDIGLGLAPALTGRGAWRNSSSSDIGLRTNHLSKPGSEADGSPFNQRAIRLYDRVGFELTQEFTHERVAYWVMVKSLGDSAHQSLTARLA